MKIDYEAAAKAYATEIPFFLNWDNLSEHEQACHLDWAEIIVGAALPDGDLYQFIAQPICEPACYYWGKVHTQCVVKVERGDE